MTPREWVPPNAHRYDIKRRLIGYTVYYHGCGWTEGADTRKGWHPTFFRAWVAGERWKNKGAWK